MIKEDKSMEEIHKIMEDLHNKRTKNEHRRNNKGDKRRR